MDTAQFPLAKEYGWNPLTGDGWSERQYQGMLARIRSIPCDKIFYVELSDVIAPSVPLYAGSRYDEWAKQTTSERNDRFIWAICGRPVPLVGRNAGHGNETDEDVGGARVVETLEAILSTGYKGAPVLQPVSRSDSQDHSCLKCSKHLSWSAATWIYHVCMLRHVRRREESW